jgi:serine/threonine protein kinase
VEELLGEGGIAAVYRAYHEGMGREVALEVLAAGLATDDAVRRRFAHEARVVAGLEHPHIIPVYEVGEERGLPFIAMRLVRGGDLRALLSREGPMPARRAAAFVSPVASALDAAHEVGLVHRDVKPANMLVDVGRYRPEHVYLSDLWLISSLVASPGQFVGTPGYAAPEQITGGDVDGRADQYGLGCVAYTLLTGSAPYPRDQAYAIMYAQLVEPPPLVTALRPDLPAAVNLVIGRAMERKRDDRYENCSAFAAALREALGLPPWDTGVHSYPRQGAQDTVSASAPVSRSHPSSPLPGSLPPAVPPGDSGRSGPGDSGQEHGGEGSNRRYLLARCPDVVAVGKPFSVLASIIRAEASAAVPLMPFSVPPEGQDILLVLHAPGLRLLGDQRITVHVPATADSHPVMFELRADEEGPRSISITAWLGGTYLGELLVGVNADRGQVGARHREFRSEIDGESSEGAVSLVVRYDPGLNAYRFEFRDEDNPGEVVSRLSFEPRQRIERLVADLDRLAAGRGGYSAAQAHDYLVNAGAELWHELVPPGLREQFWDRQHRIRQLTILADKDTVPWELLYPKDPGRDAGFLVEQFPVTRAIFGRRPASRLSLWPARFVLPRGSLPEAEAEIHAMRRLLDPSQAPEAVVSDIEQLRDAIHAGDFGLLHFACHNRFEPDDDASIRLGNVQFTPRFMTTAVIDKALARSAPTVFMNACRSAGLAPTYNRLDGWASRFLEAGAGAFIGSLWAVSDGTAREFAEELYGQLKAGTTLGRAIMDARAKAARHADDPTWLAYSAYGNPQAKVVRRP